MAFNIIVANPDELVAERVGALLVQMLSLFVQMQDLVLPVMMTELRQGLEEAGVQATLERVNVALTPTRVVYSYDADAGALVQVVAPTATVQGISIEISNYEELISRYGLSASTAEQHSALTKGLTWLTSRTGIDTAALADPYTMKKMGEVLAKTSVKMLFVPA